MDLTTRYLGFDLSSPIVPGAGPLADDLDGARRIEDAGAPMVTLRSLFEEQIVTEQMAAYHAADDPSHSYAEASTYLPSVGAGALGPDRYLEHVRRVRESVGVPVVASLNGTSPGGWLRYAGLIEQAGADALELNLYEIAASPQVSGAQIEAREIDVVRSVRESIGIPLAVKVSPFYSSVAHQAARLGEAGADALVLFNRFYQPDIDAETLSIVPTLHLSDPSELPLRLRWAAILYERVRPELAVTGGVHSEMDALGAILCGATVVQMVSALLRRGPEHLATVRRGLAEWLESHGYESLAEARGSMSLRCCGQRPELERANYMRVLSSWTGRP